MNSKNTAIKFFLICSLFLSIFNIINAYITDNEEKKNTFSGIDIVLRFPGFKIPEKNRNNVIKMKKELYYLSIALGKLFYSKKSKTIYYNKDVLRRLEVKLTKEEDNNFKEETFKEIDLLLVVKFVNFKTRVALHELLKDRDDDDEADERRSYVALLKINKNYDYSKRICDDEFKMRVTREIFKILGFRREYLKSNSIRNNFNDIPYYLIKHMKSFQSYEKYLNLTDREYQRFKTVDNKRFYKSFWPLEYGVHDILTEDFFPDVSITEITTNLINDIGINTINKCDLFKYESGFGRGFSCTRPDQKCLDKTESKEYFLEYGLYNNASVKCYLNTKENIKNKQCGLLFGDLNNLKHIYRYCPIFVPIKAEEKISRTKIPELDLYDNQTLKLIPNSKKCPSYYPRTIFFSVPLEIFANYTNDTSLIEEEKKINKEIKYDKIVIGSEDKNYFATFQTYEEYYSRESVLKVLLNSGLFRSYSHFNTHNLLIKNPDKYDMEDMGAIPFFQKMFSYNSIKSLSDKDKVNDYYKLMKKNFPHDYTYIPETYCFPEEKDIIKERFKDYELNPENLWLIKPKTGSLGEGIKFFKSLEKSPDNYLLTRYINNPHLINKRKYDFRIYVLITGLAPLKVYLYKDGIVRFATSDYSLNLKNLDELYRHLTNVEVNKKNTEYRIANTTDTEMGSKWSLLAYEKYCKHNGINYDNIRKQMADISIKSILTVHSLFLSKIQRKNALDKDLNHFKLFGFDFLVDENFRVHLLEINDRPSLLMTDINDRKLKPQLIADCLNLIGIVPYSHDYKDNFKPYEYKNKKISFEENLKDEEQEIINRAVCEFGRPKGKFEFVFPLKENVNKYKKFFSSGLRENEVLWKYIEEN